MFRLGLYKIVLTQPGPFAAIGGLMRSLRETNGGVGGNVGTKNQESDEEYSPE